MSRVVVPAIDETGARQNYVLSGLKHDTEYGFRVYSSRDERISSSSAFVFVTTAQNGYCHTDTFAFDISYSHCKGELDVFAYRPIG